MDLIVRNTGTTIAKNVRLTFDPSLRSTQSVKPDLSFGDDMALMRDGIPTLPPGREYRMLFERMPDLHANEELPRSYVATVTYDDTRGRSYELKNLLDLGIYFGVRRVHADGAHEAVRALKALNETIAGWARNGVDVRVGASESENAPTTTLSE